MDKIYLTTKEAAFKLGVSQRTVCRLAAQGLLPSSYTIGSQWRISQKALEEFIASRAPTINRHVKENEASLNTSAVESKH